MKQIVINLALYLLSGGRNEDDPPHAPNQVRRGPRGAVDASRRVEDLQETNSVLQRGLLAKAEQTQSAFWMLLAQRVMADHGGQFAGRVVKRSSSSFRWLKLPIEEVSPDQWDGDREDATSSVEVLKKLEPS